MNTWNIIMKLHLPHLHFLTKHLITFYIVDIYNAILILSWGDWWGQLKMGLEPLRHAPRRSSASCGASQDLDPGLTPKLMLTS